ncbi:auxin-induced protein X10A [Dendrobium catenatum]|uniref:Auxin-induced protein X15 n=1 Tax=Dendrobium catenatum TaxID=906689 RepID=A0A2I0V7Z2_9ASPA|nr:auxin-induced protein X10A [Dendrobium catenatum]PKU59526.1 Auxin-induced protein X15 [Dendrobium catenatum]
MEICRSSSETGSFRRKGLMSKTLRRCRSLGRQSGGGQTSPPVGWVSVRVGMEKEKFLIRAEWMNHRLFRQLLDQAEEEYGYGTKGLLELPCSVEAFNLVLWEVERDKTDSAAAASRTLCGFTASPSR